MKQKIIECRNVGYEIKGKQLLSEMDFTINTGQRIALLGHNGAGKSTLIDLITGAIQPTYGELIWYDQPGAKIDRRRIGVIFDELKSHLLLTARELINYFQKIHRIKDEKRIPFLVENLGLGNQLSKQVRVLSKGERKKLWLLLGVMHRPDFLIMDEAMAELDPAIKKHCWEQVILEDPNRTILFSTHSWNEAQDYADSVMFLSKGKMIMGVSPTQQLLSEDYLPQKNKVVVNDHPSLRNYLNESAEVYYSNQGQLNIFPKNLELILERVRQFTPNFSVVSSSLVDVYSLSIQKQLL